MPSGDSSPVRQDVVSRQGYRDPTRRWIAGRHKCGPYPGWGVQW